MVACKILGRASLETSLVRFKSFGLEAAAFGGLPGGRAACGALGCTSKEIVSDVSDGATA